MKTDVHVPFGTSDGEINTDRVAEKVAPIVLKEWDHYRIAGEGGRNKANANVDLTGKDAGAELNTMIGDAAQGCKFEFLETSTYDFQTKALWNKNMNWVGAGVSSHIGEPGAQTGAATRFLLNDNFTDDAMIEVYKDDTDTSLAKVTMRDILFDGNGHAAATAQSDEGVWGMIFRGRDAHIENVRIMDFSRQGLMCQANNAGDKKTQNSKFWGCHFGYSRKGNVLLGQNSSDLHFIGCDNYHAGGAGIDIDTWDTIAAPAWTFDDTGGGNIQIQGGQTYECLHAILYNGGGGFGTWADHRFENSWAHTIYANMGNTKTLTRPGFANCTFRENCKAAANTYDVFHFATDAANLVNNVWVNGGSITRTNASYKPRYAFGRSGTTGSGLQRILINGVLFGPYVDGGASDHFGSGYYSFIDNNYWKVWGCLGPADAKSSLVA